MNRGDDGATDHALGMRACRERGIKSIWRRVIVGSDDVCQRNAEVDAISVEGNHFEHDRLEGDTFKPTNGICRAVQGAG